MSSKIYLLQPDKSLRVMEEASYDSEDLLQRLLEEHPDLLAGDQMDAAAPRRWLLISREIGIPREEGGGDWWALDHLFLDQEAVPTLIEVKRSTDTRIRREVVGQMLDYAANAVVYWPAEKIRARFEAATESPDEALAAHLRVDPGDSDAMESFWAGLKTNLQAGRVRLVFVSDDIPPELRRIVEFLNSQMDPAEVYAVEVRQYVGERRKALVPALVGQTAVAQSRKSSSSGRQWTEASFLGELERVGGASAVEAVRDVLSWAERNMDLIWYGRGARAGSAIPVILLEGGRGQGGLNVHFFALWTSGGVEMYFQWLAGKPGFEEEEKLRELWRRVNLVPGVDLPQDSLGRRPSFPIRALVDEESRALFKQAIEWGIAEVGKAVKKKADETDRGG